MQPERTGPSTNGYRSGSEGRPAWRQVADVLIALDSRGPRTARLTVADARSAPTTAAGSVTLGPVFWPLTRRRAVDLCRVGSCLCRAC